MKQVQYKKFSWDTHSKNWGRKVPSVAQFELTFKCALHCRHCYSDCYNKPPLIKRELDTKQIKTVIDKLYSLGILWLCFTGGDPLERKDFLEIYSYARNKGFIVTVFTNAYSMTKEIADFLEKNPPFVVEITINAVSKYTYEKITGVHDSFRKTISGLDLIQKRNIPLKVKTMALNLNYGQIPEIKKFLNSRNIEFRPSALVHARLDGDTSPCEVRLTPEQVAGFDELMGAKPPGQIKGTKTKFKRRKRRNNRVFPCAVGSSDGINLDPYGRMYACCCLRKPSIDFLRSSRDKIKTTLLNEFPKFQSMSFKTRSKCSTCWLFDECWGCPGKKFLETGSLEAPLEYFCLVAEALHGYPNTSVKLQGEKCNEEIKCR